jgi:transcriptional enhancer factor
VASAVSATFILQTIIKANFLLRRSPFAVVLNLLSPNRRPCRTPSLSPEYQHKDGYMAFPPPLRYDSESCSDSSASAPPTPTEAHATLQNLLYRGVEPRVEEAPDTIIYIDLLPENSQDGASTSSWASTSQGAEERSWIERGYKVARASQHPRRLCDIDPTVTLLSKQTTTAQSYFTVHADDAVIFSEVTALELVDPTSAPTSDGSILYRTSLVPGYWDTIAQSSGKLSWVLFMSDG